MEGSETESPAREGIYCDPRGLNQGRSSGNGEEGRRKGNSNWVCERGAVGAFQPPAMGVCVNAGTCPPVQGVQKEQIWERKDNEMLWMN